MDIHCIGLVETTNENLQTQIFEQDSVLHQANEKENWERKQFNIHSNQTYGHIKVTAENKN